VGVGSPNPSQLEPHQGLATTDGFAAPDQQVGVLNRPRQLAPRRPQPHLVAPQGSMEPGVRATLVQWAGPLALRLGRRQHSFGIDNAPGAIATLAVRRFHNAFAVTLPSDHGHCRKSLPALAFTQCGSKSAPMRGVPTQAGRFSTGSRSRSGRLVKEIESWRTSPFHSKSE